MVMMEVYREKELEAYDFPHGYKFLPTDAELLEFYLRKKNDKQPLPMNKIEDVDLYNFNPWELTEIHKSYGQKECYYFTPRDRKYPNGHRPNRKAKDGYWKAVGKTITIDSEDGTHKNIGSKRTLVFNLGNSKKPKKTGWMMHEYILADDSSSSSSSLKSTRTTDKNNMRMEGWVLCKIYHNHRREQEHVEVGSSEMEVEEEEMLISTSSTTHPSSSSIDVVHEEKNSPLMIPNATLSTVDNNNAFELSQQPYNEILHLLNDVEIPDMTFLSNIDSDNGLLRGGQLDATMAIDHNPWRYYY